MRYIILALALVMAGCTAKYTKSETAGTEATTIRLDRSKAVLIAVPNDGAYGNKPHLDSGKIVAQRTAASVAKLARKVQIAPPQLLDKSELLNAARAAEAGYIFIPTIVQWEHRATEWSGIPSRLLIAFSVIDVATGNEISSVLLESRSRIVSFTSTSPESLLPELLGEHVASLY